MEPIDPEPPEEWYVGDIRSTIILGKYRLIGTRHPTITNYEVFFEDDDETGYFYAVDLSINPDNPIQDSAIVYQHLQPREVLLEIMWAVGLPRAMLICDHTPQVVFAFDIKKCWSRSNFPTGQWGDKEWSEEAWEGFEDIRA